MRRLWAVYVLANVGAILAAFFLVDPATAQLIDLGIKGSAVVAVLAGARLWTGLRRPWYFMAAGVGSFFTGYAVLPVLTRHNGGVPPFPSAADACFYLGYLGLIAGGVSLVRSRSRRREWANFVDGLIVAAGVGLVVWAFFMAPYAQTGALPVLHRAVSTGYSAFDLVLLGVWARLAIGPGARNRSYYLIGACFTFILCIDVLMTLTLAGAYSGYLNPILSELCFVTIAAGALHPAMGRLTERDHVATKLTGRRMALLASALAMGPAVLAVKAVTGRAVDSSTVVVGSVVMAGLVVVRMILLLRANERTAARERILREAGLVLVGATTKEEMHDGALSAVLALAGADVVRASLATGPADAMTVAASVGAGAERAIGHVVFATALDGSLGDVLHDRRGRVAQSVQPVDVDVDADGADDPVCVVALPLVSQNELRGLIVVTSTAPVAVEAVESLSDFASEVALALEAAALTESLHRQKSERRFKAMIESSSDLLTVVGPEGTITFASPSAARVLGVQSDALLGSAPLEGAHPDDGSALAALLAVGPGCQAADAAEVRLRHADGAWRWFEATASNLLEDPEVGGVVVTYRDVTDRKQAESELSHREARFRSLVQNSSDVVCVVGEQGLLSYVSPAAERVLGYEADALVGTDPSLLVHPEDAESAHDVMGAALTGRPDTMYRTEVRVRHADGSWHTLDITATDLRAEPAVGGVVLNARDVTDRKELEGELRFRALHDTLTGLANRALFADRVTHALQRRSDRADLVAVLFIDLDDFKNVNDSLGHAAGDELLVAVARRLQECVRLADTPARLGGDEFAILLEDVYTEEQVVVLAERVMHSLLRPFDIAGRSVQAGASVGIAIDRARASSAELLLRNADVAMYLAKERGKGRFVMFEETMHEAAVERMELKNDMPGGLTAGQFAVHYQPIVSLATGEITGVEALLRWNHPTRGPVRPDVFIPVAEQSGFIVTLGQWVLDRACADLRLWREQGPGAERMTMSVNVSVRQLEQEGLADIVAASLARHGLAPQDLTLEVTESVLMADADALRARLLQLQGLGVRVALDDFGTGYSSLKYLHELPVDIVKIDRSFVSDLSELAPDPAVLVAVVDLAEKLGLRLVAEGIEGTGQLDVLRRMGCHYGQGYYFARPMPAGDVAEIVAARQLLVA